VYIVNYATGRLLCGKVPSAAIRLAKSQRPTGVQCAQCYCQLVCIAVPFHFISNKKPFYYSCVDKTVPQCLLLDYACTPCFWCSVLWWFSTCRDSLRFLVSTHSQCIYDQPCFPTNDIKVMNEHLPIGYHFYDTQRSSLRCISMAKLLAAVFSSAHRFPCRIDSKTNTEKLSFNFRTGYYIACLISELFRLFITWHSWYHLNGRTV
jgi:hypothetical protein